MKRIRYTKYDGTLADELSLEDLMGSLGDFLLDSGFQNPLAQFAELNGEQTLENLREAIRQALEAGELLTDEQREQLFAMEEEQQEALLDEIVERLERENYIHAEEREARLTEEADGGSVEEPTGASFEVTDRGMDFLGYRALRDLLGAMGRSSLGRHETVHLASGIEAAGASKPYEFGDVLNLDAAATLKRAIEREGLGLPLRLEYDDLQVHPSEYQSSAATVVLLDCSHSMVLYGEDRFTPAKRVAMALAHLIRTQFPGDTLSVVLFHDGAEEIPVRKLPRVKVGPQYTNTREGLRVARRILARSRQEMKQIVMITDGKPSALTLEDGRIYTNPFGLDPIVMAETMEEVARCRRAGITINTFMLANDFSLVKFVQQVSAMCRGKAYYTTPETLGNDLLLDFMAQKMKTKN